MMRCRPTRRVLLRVCAQLVEFTLDDEDMATLDAMTTPEAIATFVGLYRKCVIRDTPLPPDGIKMSITEA